MDQAKERKAASPLIPNAAEVAAAKVAAAAPSVAPLAVTKGASAGLTPATSQSWEGVNDTMFALSD